MPRVAPTRSVVFFMLVVLIDSIGLGILVPVLPTLLRRIAHVDIGTAAAIGGALAFAYAIAQFFCAPVVGALSDRFGRRPVLLAALGAFALDYALMALAPALWLLAVGRVVSGITGATYSTAYAAVADTTTPAERAKSFGLMGLAFGIGFIVGPMLGGIVGGLGTRAPFVLAAILAAANCAYGFFFVPETLAQEKRRPFSLAHANPFAAAVRAARHVEIRSFLVVLMLWQFAFQALPTTWSFFTNAVLGWSSIAIGLSLAYSGVMMAVAQGALVGPLVKKIGERNAALLGLSLGSVAYVCYALAHAAWPLYLGMTLWAFGSLVSPACNAMMSQRIGADRQGELQGLVGSTYALASIVAPLALTQMFWRVGPSAPWIVSASLAALAVPIVLAAPRRTVALASNAP